MQTATLYPAVVFGICFILNCFIWGEHSSGAVSAVTHSHTFKCVCELYIHKYCYCNSDIQIMTRLLQIISLKEELINP